MKPKTKVKFTYATMRFMTVFFILTGGLSGQVHADIQVFERAGLTALYNSTNGDSWRNNGGWKNPLLHIDGFALPGTECNWIGVGCTGDSVSELTFWDNHLTGNIPSTMDYLTNLKELNLRSNQLTGNIPVDLINLTSLSFLDICDNHLYTSVSDLRGFLIQRPN